MHRMDDFESIWFFGMAQFQQRLTTYRLDHHSALGSEEKLGVLLRLGLLLIQTRHHIAQVCVVRLVLDRGHLVFPRYLQSHCLVR